jgi:hypothetical protein
MKNLIGQWIGKTVTLTVRASIAHPSIEGKLLALDESGVMLELEKGGQTFFPSTSILHISLADG